ncbi:MAG: hypothetical protein ACK5OX_10090 [Desertimonas sp.]
MGGLAAHVRPERNRFTVIWDGPAATAAVDAADAVVTGRTLGPLHGVPVAVEDTTHRTRPRPPGPIEG